MTSATQPNESWLVSNLSRVLGYLLAIATFLAVVVLTAYFIWFRRGAISLEPSDWAIFGDYVGGTLGAIFAFFALVALALTLRVQSIELSMSTTELRNSAAALERQNSALAIQSIESNIFQMLRLHNDIVEGLDLRRSGGEVIKEGRDCFKTFHDRLDQTLAPFRRGDSLSSSVDSFRAHYMRFFNGNEQNLGHYFRNLYRVYKYIDESILENKRNFTGIVRAQLSHHELALLFYNGLSSHGAKFKVLMERYAMFENFDYEKLPDWSVLREYYEDEAFGEAN